MKTIGVIGSQGVVGNAVVQGMKHAFTVVGYDLKEPFTIRITDRHTDGSLTCTTPMASLAKRCSGPIVFCLPTPMKQDGACDAERVFSATAKLAEFAAHGQVIIVKSTVPPGTTNLLTQKFQRLRFCFNPEFLTAENAVDDFATQNRIILGGNSDAVEEAAAMYAISYPDVPVFKTDSRTAEMVKYITNCFLAVKVAFSNEIKQVADRLGIDYPELVRLATLDYRLGQSHWEVPGPDGHLGYGGTCFPKDVNAMIHVADELGVDPKVVIAAWEKNIEVRPERDWESKAA